MIQYKQSSLWWLRNAKTIIYFLRECTGIVIAGATLSFLAAWLMDPKMDFIFASWWILISWIGFIAAVIHSLTWLWVTMQITPFKLPFSARVIGFIVLCGAVIAFSILTLNYLYAI